MLYPIKLPIARQTATTKKISLELTINKAPKIDLNAQATYQSDVTAN
jgi:hypothetical protein